MKDGRCLLLTLLLPTPAELNGLKEEEDDLLEGGGEGCGGKMRDEGQNENRVGRVVR